MAVLDCPPLACVPLFLFCTVILACVVQVHAQSQEGFISIDCGIADGSNYTDSDTNITFTPDAPYTEAGENKNVLSNTENQTAQYRTVRSFPNGTRNCYTLWPVRPGGKYLIRAGFWYGNYDGKNSIPVFDLHIGVGHWRTVDYLSSPDGGGTAEIITVAPADFLWVCLVNTGRGAPFISTLELRPLNDSMYVLANPSQSLILFQDRRDYGPISRLRYPDDPYDRIWHGYDPNEPSDRFWFGDGQNLPRLNATGTVKAKLDDAFQVPPSVLGTAATYGVVKYHINARIGPASGSAGEALYVVAHFAEVEQLMANETRKMNIYEGEHGADLSTRLLYANYSPPYLQADARDINATLGEGGTYNFSLYASAGSTLPCIINALESFLLRPTGNSSTNSHDVNAIQDIKKVYKLKRNWMGDPCAPEELVWDGVGCRYEASKPPRIIHLNLTSSGLSVGIAASIGNLTALTILDLSNNNMTGEIPDFLAELPSLKSLILTGNQLTGTIPGRLCEKVQNAALSLSIDGNPDPCSQVSSHSSIDGNPDPRSQVTKKKRTGVLVTIGALLVFLVLFVRPILLWGVKRRRQLRASNDLPKNQQKEVHAQNTTKENGGLKRGGRRFTYSEITSITTHFGMAIGKGGFGTVYLGYLKDGGTPVAVKVLSQSSAQGLKEFQAEAILLTRVHHKSLVSLLGYCDDEHNLALVYEYMDQGSLSDHLSDKIDNTNILNWQERVKIVLQAAQGLDYLHNGCKPSIIHRDVKSANILLSQNSIAKLADFGLSKAFDNENLTHISTGIAGTPGYLDPEYHETYRLNEKSDVYSFGIVLLEIITGQRPFLNLSERIHIVKWVHSRMECGDVSSIVDHRLCGEYNTNSMWKVLEIAKACTSTTSVQRLTMSNVVIQLKECLVSEVTHNVFNNHEMPSWDSVGTLSSKEISSGR